MATIGRLLLVFLFFLSEQALAQSPLMKTDGQPLHGSGAIADIDPISIRARVRAGGHINTRTVGNPCRGFVTQDPTYIVKHNRRLLDPAELIFSAYSAVDTTMLILTPGDEWLCDDDSGEDRNPRISHSNPEGGDYRIWVGTFEENAGIPYRENYMPTSLFITSGLRHVRIPKGFLPRHDNPGRVTKFGSNSTQERMETYQSAVGGNVDAAFVLPGIGCVGFYSDTHSQSLQWTNDPRDASHLYIYGVVPDTHSGDTAMVLRDNKGIWRCNDDGGLLRNPALGFRFPETGSFKVWMGTYKGQDFGNPNVIDTSLYFDRTRHQ